MQFFIADYSCQSLYVLRAEQLIELGFRLILLDIDNTLQAHGLRAPVSEAQRLVAGLRQAGLDCLVVSNARSSRAASFCNAFEPNLSFLAQAHKPSAQKILAYLQSKAYRREEVLLVGDQLFTDVWAAKRAGIASLYCQPLDKKEPFYIRLKRCLERPILQSAAWKRQVQELKPQVNL